MADATSKKGITTVAADTLKEITDLKTNYDDIDKFVATSGVLVALSMAFATAIATQLEPGAFDRINFRELSLDSGRFRDFVLYTLDRQDGFNYTIDVGGVVYETRDMLADYDGSGNLASGGDTTLEIALLYLFDNFDLTRMQMWMTANLDHVEAKMQISRNFYQLAAAAVVLLTIALASSITTYASLVLSPCSEDKTGEALRSWMRYGLPLTLFVYFINAIALLLYLIVVVEILFLQDFAFYSVGPLTWILLLGLACPLIVITTALSGYGYYTAATTKKRSAGAVDAEGGEYKHR